MTKSYTYLPSKPRYEILDGLRGVAAILVLIYHLLEPYAASPAKQTFLNHGYLAVDFFFLLSGFVIGYAYDNRWDKMSLKDFFKRRIIPFTHQFPYHVKRRFLVVFFGTFSPVVHAAYRRRKSHVDERNL